MLRTLFLLFILVPLLELWLLIEVGSGIGGISTIALCLLTAALGGWLIRIQGIKTLVDAQHRMAHGEVPANHGLHGLMLAVAGLLLFTPGFITDSIGFLLLIPHIRQAIINRAVLFQQVSTQREHTATDAHIIDAEVVSDERQRP